MTRYSVPQMRLGTTSYLEPVDYVPGFRHACTLCEDVTLMLMSVGENGEYLIRAKDVQEIACIAKDKETSITVHLPCEHHFETADSARRMVEDVARVVERTAPLAPHSFVLHVDFPSLHNILLHTGTVDAPPDNRLIAHTRRALEDIVALLPAPSFLAVENLENLPPSFWDAWLEAVPCSRCLDAGHLWKDGWNPCDFLSAWLDRTRVIHLHGMEPRLNTAVPDAVARRSLPATALRTDFLARFGACPRDHRSLCHIPEPYLDAVMHCLWRSGWQGVLNLEVFATNDFLSSHEAIMRSYERYLAAEGT